MALDSKQKRMSAMNLGCPWRGPMVDAPEAGTTQGNRQAAAYMYSGILAGAAVPVVSKNSQPFLVNIGQLLNRG